jgi:GTP-binding protein
MPSSALTPASQKPTSLKNPGHTRANLIKHPLAGQAAEFWELGLEPHPVSAISGTGTGEMLDVLVATLPPPTSMEVEDSVADKPLAIAIVGRPNVGELSWLVGWK